MFSSSSGEISSLSNLGCRDLPLWLVLVELPELEGGVSVDPVPKVTIGWTVPGCRSGLFTAIAMAKVYFHGSLQSSKLTLARL